MFLHCVKSFIQILVLNKIQILHTLEDNVLSLHHKTLSVELLFTSKPRQYAQNYKCNIYCWLTFFFSFFSFFIHKKVWQRKFQRRPTSQLPAANNSPSGSSTANKITGIMSRISGCLEEEFKLQLQRGISQSRVSFPEGPPSWPFTLWYARLQIAGHPFIRPWSHSCCSAGEVVRLLTG